MSWFEAIQANLEAVGTRTFVLPMKTGRLLITQTAARIIACDMPGGDRNLFWHNPEVETAETAGQITGGDRIWIAPEIAYFWPSTEKALDDPIKWAQKPEDVDPGHFHPIEVGDHHVRLAGYMRLRDQRDGKQIGFEANRGFRVIDPPAALPEGLTVGSFAMHHTAMLRDGDAGAVAGIWSVLKLPVTGTIICPTVVHCDNPTSYYDPFGDKHVQVHDDCICFLGDGNRRVKMGLPPEITTGRMGYYRQMSDGNSVLIVRIFPTLPGEPYVDLVRNHEPSQRLGGDCLQTYNHHTGENSFCEMEYHDPALIAGQYPATRSGASVTHVMVGDDEKIKAAGRMLLGVPMKV